MPIKTFISELVEELKKYHRDIDETKILKAYEFARESHVNQKRVSGEDYISHPLKVAEILAGLGMDQTTIIAALLHDVVEDTPVTLKEIKKQFGEEVEQLVDGVTKLEKIRFKGEKEQAENFRKMILAMTKDLRVILIKLADRMHNLRTISHLEKDKQVKKARETLEVYAPLAHRLGIFSLKSEIEDISFSIMEPKKYELIKNMVAETREDREGFINEVISELEAELIKAGIKSEISGRAKNFYSIHQKMKQKGKEFNQIYDLIAVRVIVDTKQDCYGALGIVHTLWKPIPGRFKDYISMPKYNLYQALHTSVIGPEGKPLEIQIRTLEMHQISEFGIAAHWMYKEGVTTEKQVDRELSWVKQIAEIGIDLKNPQEFLKAIKVDVFQDEVFIFTPRGDVMNLPVGATPLDFAYTIHTEVGHKCVGAKVNGKIVSLDYQLQTGDFIEIMTSKSSNGPSRDWLDIATTSRAKNKIRQWFSKEAREDTISVGRDALAKLIKKQGLGQLSLDSDVIKKVAKKFFFTSPDTMFAAIGLGSFSPKQVITQLIRELSEEEEKPEEIKAPLKPRKHEGAGVRVKGVTDVLIRLANCCNPVPGDEITGYITQGRGISVHRKDCPNMKSLREQSDRILDVYWETKGTGLFRLEIQVDAIDRTKLLRDVTMVLSESGVNILSAEVRTSKDNLANLRFIFEIGNLAMLPDILKNIKNIDSVFNAYRV